MNALASSLQSPALSSSALMSLARQAGVVPRQASFARAGKAINAGANLALCAAAGVDPVDGASRPVKDVSANVVWWRGALHHPQFEEARSAPRCHGNRDIAFILLRRM